MFNIPSDQIGVINSDLTIYSLPCGMFTTFFISYIFEIFGRKMTIFISYFLTALLYLAIPYTAPSIAWLTVIRCLIGVTLAAPFSHPLIPDYVKRTSRGAAVALGGVGMVVGEVLSMGILFNITKNMSFYSAFLIASSVVLMFSILFLFIIKDPNFETMRTDSRSQHNFRTL